MWDGGPRPALLLHGFPDDPGSWAAVAEGLAAAGHRVVAPWLRGYGPSERPASGDYGLEALARDAIALADDGGVLLVGHDWGAAIAYAAATLAPERFRALVGLSVPPLRVFLPGLVGAPGQLRRSSYMARFQLPGAAAQLRRDDLAGVEALWRAWSPGWEPPPERLAAVKETLRPRGALEAALAYYRAFARDGLRRPLAWARLFRLARRRVPLPARILVGEQDGCIAPAAFRGLERAFAAPARLEVVPGVGHFLPLEAPDRVLAAARAAVA